MLEWSLDALLAVPAIERIVVALPAGVEAPQAILDRAAQGGRRPPGGVVPVRGGAERSHSVRNALAAAGEGGDPVLVHDAARPLLTPDLAERCLAALDGVDAAIAAAPVVDTTKEADEEGLVARTLDRSRLWSVQTPQVFRRAALEAALAQPDEVLARATDDASLVEAAGGRVRLVEAPRENLKVTTPVDLRVAELLLRERRGAS
jgi:2-C-methyl-D-erythritol 4-phosphate cytidylyltransferase